MFKKKSKEQKKELLKSFATLMTFEHELGNSLEPECYTYGPSIYKKANKSIGILSYKDSFKSSN